MCNSCLRFVGKPLSFFDAVKGTDTHEPMKHKDPLVICVGRMMHSMRAKKYQFAQQMAVASLTLVSRSRQFAQALEEHVNALPPRKRSCVDAVPSDLLQLPLRVAEKLGTLRTGAIVPARKLLNGKRKQPNLDAASWNVGRATGDFVNLAVAASALFGVGVDSRPVTLGEVQVLAKKTSCCNLIENHFVEALRALDLFADDADAAKRIKSSTNANAFAKAFGKWDLHVGSINKELQRLKCEPVSVADVAINSCQLMNVLANFLFAANTSWRAKHWIVRASKVDAYFAAKERRARTKAPRRKKMQGGVILFVKRRTRSCVGARRNYQVVGWEKS